jgi:uncharacterized protein YcfJ
MTEEKIIKTETVTEGSLEPNETIEKTSVQATPHGDEEAGGAVAGGVAGAAMGAVVGGPVGAVVGGAIGAASGATAGEIDHKTMYEVVVTHEERRP